ncbi:haloacid dehalogenase-like hydrolase, partial [Escherichia coli]|nr:haloacid dehalogenase-like hydrolase [Escherichia coli]
IAFALDQIKALAKTHPEWKTQEPFKSVIENDLEKVFAGGKESLLQIMKVTHSGMTVEEYQQSVEQWLTAAKDKRFGKAYNDL